MVARIVAHHVKGADAVFIGLGSVGIIIRQTQHVARLMDQGSRAIGRVVVQGHIIGEGHAVQHKGRALIVHFLAPPGAAPARIRPGKVNVHPVHEPVGIAVKLAKIHTLRIQRGHGLLKQAGHIAAVGIPVVYRLVAGHLAGNMKLSVGGTLIVGRQALIGVAGLILTRRPKGNLL